MQAQSVRVFSKHCLLIEYENVLPVKLLQTALDVRTFVLGPICPQTSDIFSHILGTQKFFMQ